MGWVPTLSDLLRGKIDLFSIDILLKMLGLSLRSRSSSGLGRRSPKARLTFVNFSADLEWSKPMKLMRDIHSLRRFKRE